MELIVISDPGIVTNEAFIINQLFEAGLSRFHLRKPGWNITRYIDLLTEVDQSHHQAIACHQYHQLARVFDMKYLHYTEKDRMKAGKRKLVAQDNEGYVLSTSVHELSGISPLTVFQYIFYSPVFNSISKPDYRSILPDGFCLDKSKRRPNVIALGGVNESNLDRVKDMNFDGAAVLGAVWNKPEQALSNFIKIKTIADQLQ